MNLLCLNCRGFEKLQIEQKFGDMIWEQDPSILFLAETWLDKARLEDIRIWFKFGGMIEVSREGWGGGIAVFPATKADNMECGSSNHKLVAIYLNGFPRNRRKPWRFEQMWLEEEGCRVTVKDAWSQDFSGQPINRVEQKIQCCQTKLRWQSSMAIGNTRLLKEKKKLLRTAKDAAVRGSSVV